MLKFHKRHLIKLLFVFLIFVIGSAYAVTELYWQDFEPQLIESNSRYGNPAAYAVKGITYEVMSDAAGYEATGTASWYGTDFHQKRTSSGEVYDMYELTAAHKTLPLPCWVKVTNLENGKEITVKVNDRGPFHGDRLIDLSYAAAQKLGFVKAGTAKVAIKVIDKSKRPGKYYVQAGAFSSEAMAEAFKHKLQTIVRHPVSIESHHKRFLVQIGPLLSAKRVKEMKTTLAHHGIADVLSSIR